MTTKVPNVPNVPTWVKNSLIDYDEKERRRFAKRLEKLADVLEDSRGKIVNVGKEHVHFDMLDWGSQEPNVCGTIACAAGTADMHPLV